MTVSILTAWCCSTAGRAVVYFAQVGQRGGFLCVIDFDFIRGLVDTIYKYSSCKSLYFGLPFLRRGFCLRQPQRHCRTVAFHRRSLFPAAY